MPPSAAPPTPQEIQRKLSVHSASRRPHNPGLISGTESDSDSILSPDATSAHPVFNLPFSSFTQPPLFSIAEQSPGSGGEDSDEEDDDCTGWRVANHGAKSAGAAQGVESQTRAADVALKSGYLSKKGERRKTWKKRWFVLRPTHLAFYKTDAEYKLLRLLDLSDVHSCIPVILKRHSNVFGLILPKRTYYLQASSVQDVQDWVEAIEDARQMLMATSTHDSADYSSVSTPIPIPQSSTSNRHSVSCPLPISVSPHQQNPLAAQFVSSSDSEDAMSQLAPPPVGGGPPFLNGGGLTGTGRGTAALPSTNVTFAPTANKPQVAPLSTSPPKDVLSSTSKVILSGYLMKCGSKRRNWRKRWFVLTAEKLFYSTSHMDTKPHRIFAFTDILDVLDYDLPKHRHHHTTSGLTSSLSTSSPLYAEGTSGGTASSLAAGQMSIPVTTGGDLGTEAQQEGEGKNNTFKIVTTKRNLLLCAPSEEDEIKWLGAVRALIARRITNGPVGGSQQQQGSLSFTPAGECVGVTAMTGGGGLKSKVRRLSTSGVLGVGGGKSNTTTTSNIATGGGAPTTTFTVIDEASETR